MHDSSNSTMLVLIFIFFPARVTLFIILTAHLFLEYYEVAADATLIPLSHYSRWHFDLSIVS